MRPRPPHAGTERDQARIARRMAGRRELRRRDRRLNLGHRELLCAIEDETLLAYGKALIGVPALAARLGRTPRTVRRLLADLECLGYLGIGERQHGHGGPAVNEYRVLSPRDRGPAGWERRRRARRARDAARKAPRQRGGVLTPVTARPLRTRVRVIAPSGTGDQDRQRPTVPVGQATRQEGWAMAVRPGEGVRDGVVDPRRGRQTDLPPPPRPLRRDDTPDREAVAEAQARIAELVRRGSAAVGWRRR